MSNVKMSKKMVIMVTKITMAKMVIIVAMDIMAVMVIMPIVMIIMAYLEFVKKFTRPNFWAKEFYTLKMRISRVFSPAINSENASLSEIWPSFG